MQRHHLVTVISSFPSRPGGKLYPGFRRKLWSKAAVDAGYFLVRVFSFFSSESTLLSRFWENISFGLSSSLAILFSRRVDVVYANTWPLLAGALTALAARLRRIPLVLTIQDVYPESLAAQGRLVEGERLYRAMLRLDRWLARQAEKLVVISQRFRRIYEEERGIPQEKLEVVYNWMDPELLAPVVGENPLRQRLGISREAFLFVAGGNISRAAGVETAVLAMEKLVDDEALHLVIAGEGQSLGACQELARRLPEGRVLFHSPWPKDETLSVLEAADVLLLTTTGKQSLASMPSKLITYLLAGRPVLAQALPGSDVAALIEAAQCGWLVTPEDAQALAESIRSVAKIPREERLFLGQSGRNYAIKYLGRAANLSRLVDVVEKAAIQPHSPALEKKQ